MAAGDNDDATGTTEDAAKRARGARLFDLRRVIGALFVVYGVILIIVGLADSRAEIRKAAGVHINFWTGVGMLLFGASMLLWAFLRPVVVDDEPPAESEGA